MKPAFLRFLLIFVCGFLAQIAKAQKIRVAIQHTFGNELMVLGEEGFRSETDTTLKISELKYYISNVSFYKKGTCIFAEPNSYRLLDVATCNPCTLEVASPKKIKYDEMRFTLGIDSATNVSGAMGGDLDPTKGMYWTWQSGYINLKMEGKTKDNNKQSKEFQLHLGGYASPFLAAQSVRFQWKNNQEIPLIFDVKNIVEAMNSNSTWHIMSPNAKAVVFSKIAAESFKLGIK